MIDEICDWFPAWVQTVLVVVGVAIIGLPLLLLAVASWVCRVLGGRR
jgi:hypothetical protein